SGYIGKLVKEGDLTEGSPLHAALHAIVGCAGAAASSQSCSAGALGGSASSLLAGLFNQADPNETREQREAKRNLITSLVTGIAAMSDGQGAATANSAATANVDNNWLATQQRAQRSKELAEAKTPLEALKVYGKWQAISTTQDLVTSGGIGAGLVMGGLNDAAGMVEFMKDPVAGLSGLYSAVSDPKVRAQIGDEAVQSIQASIDRMQYALQVGGNDQAFQLGKDLGQLIYTVGSVVSGVGGVAKAGVALGRVGIEVSSKTLGRLAAKSGSDITEQITQLENTTQKLTQDIHDVEQVPTPTPSTPGNNTKPDVAGNDSSGSSHSGESPKPQPSSEGKPGVAGNPNIDTVERAATGIEWGKGINGQGMPWEDYLESQLPAKTRLPPNFKTFDFYDPSTGTAISAKTLDTLTDAKLSKPSQVYSSLKKNIDDVAKFDGYELSSQPLTNEMIVNREVRVAIPAGTTAEQWVQINKAIAYGKSTGVKLMITVVK
ncbi:hypothetical protein NS376_23620, partial [Pseudomonas oryzihabitans]